MFLGTPFFRYSVGMGVFPSRLFVSNLAKFIIGLVLSAIATVGFLYLSIVLAIRHDGLQLFDVGARGDNSPFTGVLAFLTRIMVIAGSVLIGYWTKKWLKGVRQVVGLSVFLSVASVPAVIYGLYWYVSASGIDRSNYPVADVKCIVSDGWNRQEQVRYQCKGGKLDGILTYDWKDDFNQVYRNGQLMEDVFYDAKSGNTELLIQYRNRKAMRKYFRIPETVLDHGYDYLDPENSGYICKESGKDWLKQYRYTCAEGLLEGKFEKVNHSGQVEVSVDFKKGKMDGKIKYFYNSTHPEKPTRELDFREGILNGQALAYFENGQPEYRGSYINGKQNGVFEMYGFDGEVTASLRFADGKVVEVRK